MIPTTIPAAAPTEIARVLVAWLEVSCANAPVLCRGGKDGSEAPGGDGMGGSGKGDVDGGSGGGGYGGGAEILTGGPVVQQPATAKRTWKISNSK